MQTISQAMISAAQHHEAGRLQEAERLYRQILAAVPALAQAHCNLGVVLQDFKRPEEAIFSYDRALALQPDFVEALNSLGTAYHELGNLEAAVDCYRRVLKLRPDLVEAHNNLALLLLDIGSFQEAEIHVERALQLAPQDPSAHCSRSFLLLLKGDFERGWTEYEWRLKAVPTLLPDALQPQWYGEPLGKRRLLLHAEQGFGDTFQFIRYAALVKEQNTGALVVVQCQRPLINLLASCRHIDMLVPQGGELPPFDVHVPLMNLPAIFGTRLETVPADVPYLFADEKLVAVWRERLAAVKGFRIGINWQGRPGKGPFRLRDIPLAMFERIADVPGVQLVSLQRGEGREELLKMESYQAAVVVGGTNRASPRSPLDLGDDVDQAHGAFMDTAAVMKNLDLVITSDTSIAHLAGALAIPVWLALPYVPDWRWLLDRTDSPWYPTMRLFRQKQPGNWAGVFAEMQHELRALLGRS
jgi:Tfp pilus assembly protein PilF